MSAFVYKTGYDKIAANLYDDFVASDTLKAILAGINRFGYIRLAVDPDDGHFITLDGSVWLTPEQHSVLSALIPQDRGGTAPNTPKPDQE